jgi:molybdate transport system ATP-binding protein
VKLDVDIVFHYSNFSLEVKFVSDAAVTALFGRSGSGKTTVLNAIAGLITPAGGRIALGNTVFFDGGRSVPVQKRRVGYVFQEGRLLPHLSVRQNLLYGRFFSPQRGTEEFERIVELLDLSHLLARRPPGLSGGEKQRVAIGRALLASPRLLLMDEPLASLDTSRKAEILYYVERLRDEVRVPIVYVSHAIDEVVRLADTVVLLSDGKVAASGSVTEMAGRMDVRPYLGRFEGGAVIETRVAAHDLDWGLARLEFAGGALYAPDVDALVGEPVRVRIRARDVSLATERPQGLSMLNIIEGKVKEIGQASGAAVDVHVDAAGTPILARLTRKSVAELGLAPGKPVYALIKAVAIDRHSVGYA